MTKPGKEPALASPIAVRKKPELRSIGYIGSSASYSAEGVRINRSKGLKTAVSSRTNTGKLKPEPLK